MSKRTRAVKATISLEDREERIIQRLIAIEEARDNLLAFARFMRPDPSDVDDSTKTTWMTAKHHRAIAGALHKVEEGDINRLLLTLQPRAGKTTLTSHLFVPWYLGRHPDHSVIVATYNDNFAADHGRAIRDLMLTPQYRQVFPHVNLEESSVANVSKIVTPQGGEAFFVGRGSALSGRGAHVLIADDLIKDVAEASSATIRDAMWAWWHSVFLTRGMTDDVKVILCMTRWHPDDPPGRIIDPKNDHYDAVEAKKWSILSLPALAQKDDPLGRKVGEPLWPERFSQQFLEDKRRADPKGFDALYQGNPVRQEGNLVNEGWLKSYEATELPKLEDLRIFLGCDFALSAAAGNRRDSTCIVPAGLDADGTLWILPDVTWKQITSVQIVDAMIGYMERYGLVRYSGEKGQIAKALGPFLQKRMIEKGVVGVAHEFPALGDKQTRFQGMLARMALGRVKFPTTCPWWADAKLQLTQFPAAAHDDFVDALAALGKVLDAVAPAKRPPAKATSTTYAHGTGGWLKAEMKRERLFNSFRDF